MRKRARGITLVETLAVISIVAVLTAVLTFAVFGRSQKEAVRASIKSDLKQCVMAINMYLADNDGGYPRYMHETGYGAPDPSGKYRDGEGQLVGRDGYLLTYYWVAQQVHSRFNPRWRFDPEKHSIVNAEFDREPTHLKTCPSIREWNGDIFESRCYGDNRVPGGFMDGHVARVRMFEIWMINVIYKHSEVNWG